MSKVGLNLARQPIKTGYEALGLELYEKVLQSTSFNREEVDTIAKRLRDASSVLVVRIALGDVVKRLLEEGKTVYGIDHDQRCLDHTKRKVGHGGKAQLNLVKGDLSDFTHSNEYDAATCASIHWYGQGSGADNICSKVYQALKPDGLFVVTGIDGGEFDRSLEIGRHEAEQSGIIFSETELKKIQEATRGYPPAIRKLCRENLSADYTRRLLEKAGFNVISQESFYQDTHYVLVGKKR